MPIQSDSQHIDERVIRVFISSTFRDMQAERELLVKQVFPELRRVCAERFVTFTEVDLRWGITKEQSAEGQVLPICLEEIHRCRPYFIGLLGERYDGESYSVYTGKSRLRSGEADIIRYKHAGTREER